MQRPGDARRRHFPQARRSRGWRGRSSAGGADLRHRSRDAGASALHQSASGATNFGVARRGRGETWRMTFRNGDHPRALHSPAKPEGESSSPRGIPAGPLFPPLVMSLAPPRVSRRSVPRGLEDSPSGLAGDRRGAVVSSQPPRVSQARRPSVLSAAFNQAATSASRKQLAWRLGFCHSPDEERQRASTRRRSPPFSARAPALPAEMSGRFRRRLLPTAAHLARQVLQDEEPLDHSCPRRC